MARRCQISGTGRLCGHRVSHAKNRTNHVFQANIQPKRIYIPEEKRYVNLHISTRMIRTIDKMGLAATLKKYGMTIADLA